jgi:hypothetical protein
VPIKTMRHWAEGVGVVGEQQAQRVWKTQLPLMYWARAEARNSCAKGTETGALAVRRKTTSDRFGVREPVVAGIAFAALRGGDHQAVFAAACHASESGGR